MLQYAFYKTMSNEFCPTADGTTSTNRKNFFLSSLHPSFSKLVQGIEERRASGSLLYEWNVFPTECWLIGFYQ